MSGIKRNMFPPPDLSLKNGEKHLPCKCTNGIWSQGRWKLKLNGDEGFNYFKMCFMILMIPFLFIIGTSEKKTLTPIKKIHPSNFATRIFSHFQPRF